MCKLFSSVRIGLCSFRFEFAAKQALGLHTQLPNCMYACVCSDSFVYLGVLFFVVCREAKKDINCSYLHIVGSMHLGVFDLS